MIWIAPDDTARHARLVRDGADEIGRPDPGSAAAADEQTDPRTAGRRTFGTRPGRSTGTGWRPTRPARPLRSGAAGTCGRAADQRRRGQFDLVRVLCRCALDEAHRRKGDVDEIELVGQRLHDAAEPIVAVGEQRLAQAGAEHLRPSFAEVGHRRQVRDLQPGLRRRLDVAQQSMLARLDEGDGHALAPGTPGPPDPVDVGVRVRRHIEVDDVRDMLDVEAARRDIGGDQDVERPVPEAAHDPVAALLRQPAVEGAGIMAPGAQRLGEVVHLAARPPEDECGCRVLDVEDAAQRGQLVRPPDDVRDLPDEGDAVAGGLVRRGP